MKYFDDNIENVYQIYLRDLSVYQKNSFIENIDYLDLYFF
jgi:hypothetical protein